MLAENAAVCYNVCTFIVVNLQLTCCDINCNLIN